MEIFFSNPRRGREPTTSRTDLVDDGVIAALLSYEYRARTLRGRVFDGTIINDTSWPLLQDLLASREREKQKDAELEALKAGGPELQGSGQESTVDDDKQYEGMSAGEIIALKAKQAGGWQ